MSAQPTADVVAAIRSLVGDTGTGRAQLVRDETPAGTQDGTNKRFTLQWFPIVSGTLILKKNDTILVDPTDFTIVLDTGIINLVVAPAFADRVSAEVYRHLWFKDNEYHEFIFNAAQHTLGVTPKGATVLLRADNSIKDTFDGLMDALRMFAGYEYNVRRADEAAHEFSSAAGGQNVTVDVRTKSFLALAKDFWDRAIVSRGDFYKRRGGRDAPASAIANYNPILRYQPRR